MTIGELIVKYRKEQNISQRGFAEKCGLSNGIISLLEKGINPKTNEPIIPTLPTLNCIAKGMGIKIDTLLETIDDLNVSLLNKSRDNSSTYELVHLISQLTPEQQELIAAQIKGILNQKNNPQPK